MINLSATLLSTELITYQPRRLATNFFSRPTAGSVYNLFAFWTIMPREGVGLRTIDHGCFAQRHSVNLKTGSPCSSFVYVMRLTRIRAASMACAFMNTADRVTRRK